MSKYDFPSVDYIKQALRYDDGRLFWLERPLEHFKCWRDQKAWNAKFAGKEAGCHDKTTNRIVIGHNKMLMFRYHVVWAIHHGEWPTQNIDHENRNPLDDKIGNLRLCTQGQNVGNSTLAVTNKSGYKGVSWSLHMKKWIAGIGVNGKRKHLGYFDDPAEAHAAYMKAARERFGEFAHDGT